MDAAGGTGGTSRPSPRLHADSPGGGGRNPPAGNYGHDRISNQHPRRTTRATQTSSTLKRKRSCDDSIIPTAQPGMPAYPSTDLDTTCNADSIDSDESLLEEGEEGAAMDPNPDSEAEHLGLPNAMIAQHRQTMDLTDIIMPSAAPPLLPNERSLPDGPDGPMALPATKVFPIQVGSKLFSLSGASLSSDAPSYFTRFFGAQLDAGVDAAGIKTLYLDRDPDTFTDISLHLQGYHVEPRDGLQFVRLFADAQFFNLPRLIQRLYKSDIFVRVGDREFKISRDLLEGPGDSPNYFNLGFGVFFNTPEAMFPGLRTDTMLRPPAIKAPHIESRSPEVFEDLLKVLQGYEGVVKDEAHRETLLRDARYYHLRGLEQKLLACRIEWNVFLKREEIMLRLQDLKPAGLGIDLQNGSAELKYARPHVDQAQRHLIISVPERTAYLDFKNKEESRIVFAPATRSRIISLHRLLYTKWREATKDESRQLAPERVERPRARFSSRSHITVNEGRLTEESDFEPESGATWALGKSLWSVSLAIDEQGDLEIYWHAIRLEAWTDEQEANGAREWL